MTDGNEPINMDVTDTGSMGGNYGLTKREYFTAMAMQGMLANNGIIDIIAGFTVISEAAVKYADALINDLNKG